VSPRVDALLLDLDGTLVDSRRDLATAVNLLLSDLGASPLPDDVVASFVGRGARSLIGRALDAADPGGRVPRDESLYGRFLSLYDRVLLDTTVLFPGVRDGLATLRQAGVRLAVVTNKPLAPTLRILAGLDATACFDAILGGDGPAGRKPDPGMLLAAAATLAVPAARCVMVGDSDIDIEAAARAGMPGFWCAWGGLHPDRPGQAELQGQCFGDVVSWVLSPTLP
jgi:phosphoglycolate phosphatase